MNFKICAVGCGWMAETGHGPAFKKYKNLHEGICLSACCDLDKKRADAFAEKFGFERSYTDFKEMLDKERPDAVSLISSVSATKALALDIIKRGYPLIVEKPPGINAEEAAEIAEAAKVNGVAVRVAFNRRYMPLLRLLKNELLKNNEHIHNITYLFVRKGRKDPDFSTTAIHGIDAVRYLAASDYRTIQFEYRQIPGCEAHVSNICMQCGFHSGTTGQLIFMPMGGGVVERAVVSLSNSTYFLDLPVWGAVDSPGRLMKIADNRIEYTISGDDLPSGNEMFETNGFYAENELFFDDLQSGADIVSDIESGIQPVDIADCIRNKMKEYKTGE